MCHSLTYITGGGFGLELQVQSEKSEKVGEILPNNYTHYILLYKLCDYNKNVNFKYPKSGKKIPGRELNFLAR